MFHICDYSNSYSTYVLHRRSLRPPRKSHPRRWSRELILASTIISLDLLYLRRDLPCRPGYRRWNSCNTSQQGERGYQARDLHHGGGHRVPDGVHHRVRGLRARVPQTIAKTSSATAAQDSHAVLDNGNRVLGGHHVHSKYLPYNRATGRVEGLFDHYRVVLYRSGWYDYGFGGRRLELHTPWLVPTRGDGERAVVVCGL